jgi:hypothetical protein
LEEESDEQERRRVCCVCVCVCGPYVPPGGGETPPKKGGIAMWNPARGGGLDRSPIRPRRASRVASGNGTSQHRRSRANPGPCPLLKPGARGPPNPAAARRPPPFSSTPRPHPQRRGRRGERRGGRARRLERAGHAGKGPRGGAKYWGRGKDKRSRAANFCGSVGWFGGVGLRALLSSRFFLLSGGVGRKEKKMAASAAQGGGGAQTAKGMQVSSPGASISPQKL